MQAYSGDLLHLGDWAVPPDTSIEHDDRVTGAAPYVDILVPHASRLASLTVHPISGIERITRLLEQHMIRLRHLTILDCARFRSDTPLTLSFDHYPNIHSLQLHRTHFYSPVAPCASLSHLELERCTIRAWPTAGHDHSLRSVHDALEFFPYLETLSLTYSLSNCGWHGDLPELTKTIHLPRLRHVEIEDIPVYIPLFLSHLAFPSTTSFVLEPAYRLAIERPVTVPVFPGINPSPTPDTEIGLYLNFSGFLSEGGLARWETHGKGARPVRVTLVGAARSFDTISHFTREFVHALGVPAPVAGGVTEVTAKGTWARSIGRHSKHCAREYWTAFLPDLAARLRRLACATDGATKDFIHLLGRPLDRSGEFPYTGLEELALVWDLPHGADLELVRERWSRGGEGNEGATPDVQYRVGRLSSPELITVSLGALCDTFGACLAARAGRCEPIRKLSVALCRPHGGSIVLQGWQAALVEQQLRDGLGDLVGEVAVVDEVN